MMWLPVFSAFSLLFSAIDYPIFLQIIANISIDWFNGAGVYSAVILLGGTMRVLGIIDKKDNRKGYINWASVSLSVGWCRIFLFILLVPLN
jgi:hypothetical protein